MKKTMTIGVQAERNRAHGRALLEGIARFASSQGDWRLDLVEPERLASGAGLSRYDGFIVRVMDDRTARTLADARRPVVDTYGRVDAGAFATIRLDDKAIADMAVRFFESHLFRSCAFCGFGGLRFSAEREEAFRAGCAARGMACARYEPRGAGVLSDAFFQRERVDSAPDGAALARWVRSLPAQTAVLCCNDLRAFQLARVCEDLGLRIPEDIAILGVDNDTLLCSFGKSPLSSIETAPAALGARAGEILAGMLAGAVRPKTFLHGPRGVVERQSTDIFRSSTPWFSDVMRHLVRNIPNGINADDVFRHAGYSRPTVNKVFLAETGATVKQEIVRRRLELACRLLRDEKGLTAAEVAARAGFASPQYFSRAFSEALGSPPDSWRARSGRSSAPPR